MYAAYQWSTAWGVGKNKIAPAIKAGRGRDLITHWLKLYPNQYTKKAHEIIGSTTGLWSRKSKKRKTSRPTDVQRALAVLEGMRR